MKVQTAGQQKYQDFIRDRESRIRTGMIIWGSLIGIAVICGFSDIRIALILGVLGVGLAVIILKARRSLREKLDGVENKEEFYRQLTAPDILEIENPHLLVAKDYVLVYRNDIYIYSLKEMEKLEVGIRGDKKTLFLTDKNGNRHELISSIKGSTDQKDFDRVYYRLKDRI